MPWTQLMVQNSQPAKKYKVTTAKYMKVSIDAGNVWLDTSSIPRKSAYQIPSKPFPNVLDTVLSQHVSHVLRVTISKIRSAHRYIKLIIVWFIEMTPRPLYVLDVLMTIICLPKISAPREQIFPISLYVWDSLTISRNVTYVWEDTFQPLMVSDVLVSSKTALFMKFQIKMIFTWDVPNAITNFIMMLTTWFVLEVV